MKEEYTIDVFSSQIRSLSIAKKYIQSCKIKKIKTDLSPYCDFVTWANCLGLEKLLLLINNKRLSLKLIQNFIVEFLAIGQHHNYLLSGSLKDKKNILNVVYSYCSKENFDNNGNFYDYYFKDGNSLNNTIWFLISLDNFVPHNAKNCLILYKRKNFNFLYFIKYITRNCLKKNFMHLINNTTNLTTIYTANFFKIFREKNFNLFMPFENRPHQNSIIRCTKRISKKNKIYGYYHRMPEPFQSEMIFKGTEIDKLYVCSDLQKKIFNKYYNWPKKKVKVINSIRYPRLKKRNKTIFLPFEIKNIDFLIRNLTKFLSKKNFSLKDIKISLHPLKKKSKKHQLLRTKIKTILNNLKNKRHKKKESFIYPIILGEPGGVAAECLQSSGKVYHITDSFFDIFSHKIWKGIQVKKIIDDVYEYTKEKKVQLVKLNGKKNNF